MIRKRICDKCGTPREPDSKRCKPCRKAYLDVRNKRLAATPIDLSKIDFSRLITCPKCDTERKCYLPSGRRRNCPECSRVYRNEPNNNAKAREVSKTWRDGNRERFKEFNLRWRSSNPEYRKQKFAEWKAANPNYSREYRTSHRKLVNFHKAMHQARRTNAEGNMSPSEWEQVKDLYGRKCVDCGKPESEEKLTIGHAIPLRMGGSNWPSNIVPQCRNCNSSQGGFKIHRLADPTEVASLELNSVAA